jgi:hypothetical protein
MAMTAKTVVLKYLMGKYPTSRDELVERAARQGADSNIISLVRRLPDKRYESSVDVEHALGEDR